MAKQPRTKMSGKEARYIIKENRINMAWLAEQLGITPQTLNSRLNAQEFRRSSMMEINAILGKDIFGIGDIQTEVIQSGQQPILDIRVSTGYGIGQSMKNDRPIFNYLKVMRKHADEAIRTILDALKTDDPHEPSAH